MQREKQAGGRPGGWLLDHPWVIILIVLFAGFAWWVRGTRHEDHHVRVRFDEAVSLYSGLDVRVDGLDAGKITKVEHGDTGAIITLGLKGNNFWPLHEGTKATLRFGTTIGNGTRIIDLDPGPKSAPEIGENGIIPTKDSVETTEFDDIFDTFNGKTRTALQGALKGTGETFGPRAKELGDGVATTSDGLQSVSNLANDLTKDEPALRALVANTYRVTSAIAARRDQLSDLVQVAATTFRTFAANTNGIRDSLDRFPQAQRDTQTTLARVNTSLDHLQPLMTDLAPGARELAGLSKDLRPALADLRTTVPVAVQTFRTARKAAPRITSLLKETKPFSAGAAPALTDLAPMIGCIRPYSPEIAGLLSTWSSFTSPYDKDGHLGRLSPNVSAASVTSLPINAATLVKTVPGQTYALVRPPGYNVGKPFYQPECGITPDGVNPDKDPEAGK